MLGSALDDPSLTTKEKRSMTLSLNGHWAEFDLATGESFGFDFGGQLAAYHGWEKGPGIESDGAQPSPGLMDDTWHTGTVAYVTPESGDGPG